MKQLTCEMCGSTDLMKQDGVFVCQTCGTKYSVEEAKKMMVEGTVSVSGSVQTDSSHLVQNYIEMARNARNAGNNEEAEEYCNRIIEVDPTNYEAWILKGEASAWQSTLVNLRITEGINAFAKGVNYTPEEEKDDVIDHVKKQITTLCIAIIKLQAERFSKWPDEEETIALLKMLTTILSTVVNFLSQTSILVSINDIMQPVASLINQSVAQAYKNVIYPEYKSDRYPFPDRDDWDKFITRIDLCIKLVEKSIALCEDNEEETNIQRYENLIFLEQKAIESCSYDWKYLNYFKDLGPASVRKMEAAVRKDGNIPDSANDRYYYMNYRLSSQAMATRQNNINKYETKIKEIKEAKARKEAAEKAERERIAREEAKKRYDAYWSEHAAEKTALKSEKESLNEQIKSIYDESNVKIDMLDKAIDAIPGKTEIANIEEHIKKLSADKQSLGIFKVKEKKVLQTEIDRLNTEKQNVQSKMAAAKSEIEQKIKSLQSDAQQKAAPLQSRCSEIENELTKER